MDLAIVQAFVLGLFVIAVRAGGHPNGPHLLPAAPLQRPIENDYGFRYAVNDMKGNEHSHQQQRVGNAVTGQYKVLLPDGRLQTVTYIADEKGYRAKVEYSPAHPGEATTAGQNTPTPTGNVPLPQAPRPPVSPIVAPSPHAIDLSQGAVRPVFPYARSSRVQSANTTIEEPAGKISNLPGQETTKEPGIPVTSSPRTKQQSVLSVDANTPLKMIPFGTMSNKPPVSSAMSDATVKPYRHTFSDTGFFNQPASYRFNANPFFSRLALGHNDVGVYGQRNSNLAGQGFSNSLYESGRFYDKMANPPTFFNRRFI